MASNDYQVPDLASILQTLAALAPQGQNQVQIQPVTEHSWPAQAPLHQPASNPRHDMQPYVPAEQRYVPPPVPKQVTNSVDPTTIIDWSSGLRCIMKTVAVHDTLAEEIRRMIKVQHEHEDQWWNGRQALIAKQGARVEGQKKLDDVLKAVGGATFSGNTLTGAEAAAEELKTFDMKVYRAQLQMVKEMSTKLKNLGVPFFGTRTDLVRLKGKDESDGYDGSGELKKRIDEMQLVELQKRMLKLLEELCQA